MSYKPIDSKRDQFRRYVESHGVVDMFTKVLIQLMRVPEKPDNPIEFIRENLGVSLKEKQQIELLQQEVEFFRQRVDDLTKQLDEAKSQLQGNQIQVFAVDSQTDAAKPAEIIAVEQKDSAASVVEAKESAAVVVEAKVSSPLPAAADDVVAKVSSPLPAAAEPAANDGAVGLDDATQKEVVTATIETSREAEEPSEAIQEAAASASNITPPEAVVSETVAKLTESEEKIAVVESAVSAAN